MDTPRIERRGRPAKHLAETEFHAVMEALRKRCTFVEACKHAGTSAYVVRKAMRESALIDYQVRLACITGCRKKLCDNGVDPDVLVELALDAALVEAGEAPRDWLTVQERLSRKRETRAAIAEAQEAFRLAEPRTTQDEYF